MKKYVGINVQYPISQLILDGSKTIETRTYPIPENYVGKHLLLIETPGKLGNFRSRIIAKIIFGAPFKYSSKDEFYLDTIRHKVDRMSDWAWANGKPKWGWPIIYLKKLKAPVAPSKRIGIKYTKDLEL